MEHIKKEINEKGFRKMTFYLTEQYLTQNLNLQKTEISLRWFNNVGASGLKYFIYHNNPIY
jgi:hypothetical protein